MTDQPMPSATGELASALAEVGGLLANDGFTSAWEVTEAGVVFRVGVGDTECADCLVPRPVLEVMLNNALQDTDYTLARVEMPASQA